MIMIRGTNGRFLATMRSTAGEGVMAVLCIDRAFVLALAWLVGAGNGSGVVFAGAVYAGLSEVRHRQ